MSKAESGAAPRSRRAVKFAAAAAGLGLLIGTGAALFVFASTEGGSAHACAAAADTAAALDPLAVGPLAGFQPLASPVNLQTLAFQDGAGRPTRLADFEGKTVLFNLWATWCAPCRAEMPSLARLQTAEGGADFEVVAVSIDTRPDAPVGTFLEETDATALTLYRDETMSVFNTLRDAGLAIGMPTTLLVDDNGCGLGVLHGAAHWDAPEAVSIVRAVTGG